jgi:hypothetical protein
MSEYFPTLAFVVSDAVLVSGLQHISRRVRNLISVLNGALDVIIQIFTNFVLTVAERF